jgi:hypothetical protein
VVVVAVEVEIVVVVDVIKRDKVQGAREKLIKKSVEH